MTNEERKDFYMNRNIKLSPMLIALTWDVFFVWTISTLFLTQIKGLTNSQVVALDSILMASGGLMCIPLTKIFQKITPVKATQVAMCGYAIFLLIYIFGNGFWAMAVAQPFLAFGYVVNYIKINSILTQSLNVVKRDKDYQRVYGKGVSIYYVLECVGAIIITYVYSWNAYYAFWLSLIIVVLTFLLTFLFKEPTKYMNSNIQLEAKEPTEKIIKKPDKYLTLFKSAFFVTMVVYMFVIRGVVSISGSSFRIYLNILIERNAIPIWLYGYLYAGSRLCAALFSKFQFKFDLKFGVRSLIIFVFLIVLSFVLSGVFFLINPTSIVSIVVITLSSFLMCSLRMPNSIFVGNYLQVCTPRRNHEKAHSIKLMAEYLGYAVFSAIYAGLLAGFNDNYGLTNLVYIAIAFAPLLVSLAFFLKYLIKKHAQKFTVVKDEYTKD